MLTWSEEPPRRDGVREVISHVRSRAVRYTRSRAVGHVRGPARGQGKRVCEAWYGRERRLCSEQCWRVSAGGTGFQI